MSCELELESMKSLIASRHDTGKIQEVLPFIARDKKIKLNGDLKNIVGEFGRQVEERTLDNAEDPLGVKEETAEYGEGNTGIIKKICQSVECDSEESRKDLERLLKSVMSERQGAQTIKAIHPHIYLYYPLSNDAVGKFEKKIGIFLRDILTNGDRKAASNVFHKQRNEDLLVNLILEHLDSLGTGSAPSEYQPLLPSFNELFLEDFLYLSKYRDYFLSHLELFTHHYFFMYVAQLTSKFHMFDKANYDYIDPFYYALDWERVSKRRPSISDPLSFKGIREKASHVFIHIHAQAQLSHIAFNKITEAKKRPFCTYSKLSYELHKFEDLDPYIESFNNWIKEYAERWKLELPEKAESVSDSFRTLHKMLEQGMNEQVYHDYGKAIENIAQGSFLKFRGNLGYSLNITQEFLLLLTALAVKEQEKIPLSTYFEELERRGVALDQYSKEEVMVILDNLNIIEKKSDSGDAQYVKSIL